MVVAPVETDSTIEKGITGVGEGTLCVYVCMRVCVCLCVQAYACVCGGGGGGDSEAKMNFFVNILFGLTVRVFIHRVLVTWYFKNRRVSCVFTHVQL